MHKGHTPDICNIRETETYRTERMSNVHPTDEYRIKRTTNGNVPDKTDEQDIRKNQRRQ